MKLTIIANKTSEPISVGEEDRIRAYIQAHNLEEKVTVLQNINYDDIPAHYASAHLFILPASHEPLGYSVVEAMAAGLPVITSADAGAASYVKNGQNGYTFTPKSKTELKKVIKKFFSNNTINWRKLQKIGKQNRRVATQHHDPQKWVSLCKN